ncbi:MAG: hypothetical protein J6D02_09860 [Lachnospira sp.]|nr:hypothetical protein [Lachnospira sp.]
MGSQEGDCGWCGIGGKKAKREDTYVGFNGITPEDTMDLFRCTEMSISRIFPYWNQCATQPTLIRHPWLKQRLFGTSSPEIAVD